MTIDPVDIKEQYNVGVVAALYAERNRDDETVDLGRQYLRKHLEGVPRDSKLLDVGCGSAIDLLAYKQMGFTKLFGVDPAQKYIEVSRRVLGESADIRSGDFENIPFADGTFDILTSRYALHYSKDITASISEAARVLVRGGKLMIITHHPDADALEEADANGNISITMFERSVSITFPRHRMDEYFSAEFEKLFSLDEKIYEYVAKHQDRGANGVFNSMGFIATKL